MRNRISNEKGFSLVEACLAITVLAIGLTGGLATFTNATAGAVGSDNQVVASQLASETLETIFVDKNDDGYAAITTAGYPAGPFSFPHAAFTKTVTVTEVDSADMQTASVGSGYKRVDVTVSWGTASSESIGVSTVLTNY